MKNLVRYAIIRFMPFTQTQEFANVGVIVHAPQLGAVLFKLANKRFGRVSQFFDDLDGTLYSNAIKMFEVELNRIQSLASGMVGKKLALFMDEVTRPKEGFLTFSETAVLLTDDDLDTVLDGLFRQYVGRDFNTKEHRETLLVKELRPYLNKVSKYKYTKSKVSADYMSFELPLVATDNLTTKAIKPLSFLQETPLKLIDHGGFWISRVKHLLNSNTIAPKDFLFAVEKPLSQDRNLEAAFGSLTYDMASLGVYVCDVGDLICIENFARFDSESSSNFELSH
ncbi:DUF3037 domain-containing protein [Plesiomonas shigelloides]|uniref:DUF3037 domain-containing protein n=1 Tax=Plesiomonas shigelloides TaxID=703 RepID=UPI001261B045|nr:DUF3037 domain-containing protein [Plesiomonas shigelloides]KAB7660498.1 DUF3037 domain-containing protein [Plesiomonas shigelloides]